MVYKLIFLASITFLSCKYYGGFVKPENTSLDNFWKEKMILNGVELLVLKEIEFDNTTDFKALMSYKVTVDSRTFQDSVFSLLGRYQHGESYMIPLSFNEKKKRIIEGIQCYNLSTVKDTFFALQGRLLGTNRHSYLYLFSIKKEVLNRYYFGNRNDINGRNLAINTVDSFTFNNKCNYPDVYVSDIDNFKLRLRHHRKDVFKIKVLK